MMSLRKNILSVSFSGLSVFYAFVLVNAYAPELLWTDPIPLQARALSQQLTLDALPWQTIDPEDMDTGVTIKPGVNTIFTLPPDATEVRREVLFGYRGEDTRYWGYCFDPDYEYDQSRTVAQSGFPGKMFLSEAERAWRTLRQKQQKPLYTIYSVPTKNDLSQNTVNGPIRHQIEVFTAGITCYVMAEKILPLGSDRDNDGLNSRLEKEAGTNAVSPDTDNDGILDGTEKMLLKTDPLRRDTDGDGLIDGIEDRNHDGYFRAGESDALKKDSDADGLCDGYCREFTNSRICEDNLGSMCADLAYGRWMGEDKNLNGKVDSGETDPRLWSTFQNGISDMQMYYKCILAGGKDC